MTDEKYPDTIFLRDMRVETVVGIWDWERKIRQVVSIDLEMGADIRRAAATGGPTMTEKRDVCMYFPAADVFDL